MDKIVTRRIGVADIDQLQAIGIRTFRETFVQDNTTADMEQYIASAFNRDKLLDEIGDAGSRFLFAELDGRAIGYLKVNTGRAQTERRDDRAMEIERIYVLKEFHGRKLGQLLLDQAIAVATELEATHVWLGVWERNVRAIGFYKKNGFVEVGKHVFKLGEDEQTDVLMERVLNVKRG